MNEFHNPSFTPYEQAMLRKQEEQKSILVEIRSILFKIFILVIIVVVVGVVLTGIVIGFGLWYSSELQDIVNGFGTLSAFIYNFMNDYDINANMRKVLPADEEGKLAAMSDLWQGLKDAADVITTTRDLGIMSVLYGVGRVIMDISDSPLSGPGANGVAAIFDWTKTKIDSGQVDRGFASASTTLDAIAFAVNTTHFQSATASIERILANPLVENITVVIANISSSPQTHKLLQTLQHMMLYGTEGERAGQIVDRAGELGAHITDIVGQIKDAHVFETVIPRSLNVAESAVNTSQVIMYEAQTYMDYRQQKRENV